MGSKIKKVFGFSWRIFYLEALFVLVFVVASIVKVQAASRVIGWLWGGSEDANIGGVVGSPPPDGNETGVGWVSMGESNYSITIDNAGKVMGYAWANASDFPNSNSSHEGNGLGWVDFNPQDHCVVDSNNVLDDLSSFGRYEADSCSPPSGSAGVYLSGSSLSGWARFVGIAQESVRGNSGGWEGWLKMHNATIDPSTGQLSGYAWNGEESGMGNNLANGLGWIDFSRARIEEICSLEFVPLSKTMKENSTSGSSEVAIREVGSNCNCGTVALSSSNTSVVNVAPVLVDFSSPTTQSSNITLQTGAVSGTSTYNDIIAASSAICGTASLDLTVENVPVCNISCPESYTVAPDGEWHSYDCSVTGEAGCKVDSCSKISGSSKIEVQTGSVLNTCEVKADPSAHYDTAVSRATAGTGSDDTNINVRARGWIETNP